MVTEDWLDNRLIAALERISHIKDMKTVRSHPIHGAGAWGRVMKAFRFESLAATGRRRQHEGER
jgi:hypothetical protein